MTNGSYGNVRVVQDQKPVISISTQIPVNGSSEDRRPAVNRIYDSVWTKLTNEVKASYSIILDGCRGYIRTNVST